MEQRRNNEFPGGRVSPIEVHDFHFGRLPNELAGVHEGAVRPGSQLGLGFYRGAGVRSFRLPIRMVYNDFCGGSM